MELKYLGRKPMHGMPHNVPTNTLGELNILSNRFCSMMFTVELLQCITTNRAATAKVMTDDEFVSV